MAPLIIATKNPYKRDKIIPSIKKSKLSGIEIKFTRILTVRYTKMFGLKSLEKIAGIKPDKITNRIV